MIPSPVWKSSYRLIFGDKEPMLEGWAIVDNTTGEDWTKVKLSLVSGRPISFVSQLYAPKYINRPGAELADDAAAQPVVHSGGFRQGQEGDGGAAPQERFNRLGEARARPRCRRPRTHDDGVDRRHGRPSVWREPIQSAAEGRELGELFEYRIAQPVTIRKNESAMLPFLQQPSTDASC